VYAPSWDVPSQAAGKPLRLTASGHTFEHKYAPAKGQTMAAATPIKLHVPDMSCGHCKAAVEKAVAAVDAKADLKVNLIDRTIDVATIVPIGSIRAALEGAGYRSEPAA
jgi:copper chaperone